MKVKTLLLIGLPMLFLSGNLSAEISTSFVNGTLSVSTNQLGIKGLKGCDAATAKAVPAYKFELQTNNSTQHQSCPQSRSGKWHTIATQVSPEGNTKFYNLPDGSYRIICHSGQSIGCSIEKVNEDHPPQSIVYEVEKSPVFQINQAKERTQGLLAAGKNTSEALMLFPNPNKGNLNIRLNSSELKGAVDIVLYNLLGKELKRWHHPIEEGESWEWQVDLKDLANGAYIVRVTDLQGHQHSGRLVFQND